MYLIYATPKNNVSQVIGIRIGYKAVEHAEKAADIANKLAVKASANVAAQDIRWQVTAEQEYNQRIATGELKEA